MKMPMFKLVEAAQVEDVFGPYYEYIFESMYSHECYMLGSPEKIDNFVVGKTYELQLVEKNCENDNSCESKHTGAERQNGGTEASNFGENVQKQ